jgi:hypothetical protein
MLRAWLLLLLLLAGCARRSTSEPGATTPRAGDYLSAVVPASPFEGSDPIEGDVSHGLQASVPTDVKPSAEHTTLTLYRRTARDRAARVLLAPWGDPAALSFVVADEARGLRLVHAAEPAHARVSAGVPLPGGLAHLQVVGEHALLVFPRGMQHELWWFELSAQAGPRLLSVHTATGDFRGAYVTRAAEEPARLHALVDHYDERARRGTLLRVFELAERALIVRHELELGASVSRVERAGDVLFVSDGSPVNVVHEGDPVSLRQLEIGLGEAPPILHAPRSVGRGIHAARADDAGVHVIWSKQEGLANAGVLETFHVERWPWGARHALGPPHDCVTSTFTVRRSPLHLLVPPALSDVQFFPGRTILTLGVEPVRALAADTCALSEYPLEEGRSLAARGGARWLRVSADDRGVRVSLFDSARLTTPLAVSGDALPAPGRADVEERYYQTADAKLFERTSTSLLTLPLTSDGEPTSGRGATQLFELTDDRITRAGRLEGDLWLAPSAAPATLLTQDGLAFVSLADPRAAQRLGSVELWPTFERALTLPGGIARVRALRAVFAPRDENMQGRLELVPRGSDPQTGPVSASFALPVEAQLRRVGPLLVSIGRKAEEGGDEPAVYCRIEVFDTRELGAARRVATLHQHASLCEKQDLFLPLTNALVFVSPERRYQGRGREPTSSRFALHVLDLSDPQYPRFHAPFRTPDGEFALRAFARDSQLVYSYRVAAGAAPPAQAHHYLRVIELSDPSRPRFDAPVSVAGEVMALAGDGIYTRDASWTDAGLTYSLRKLIVREHRATLVATQTLVGREVSAIDVPDPATVLVSVVGAAPDRLTFVREDPHLRVFTADTLMLRGELRVNDESAFVAASSGVALYESYGSVHVVDYRDPDRPRLASILSSAVVAGVERESALLLQSGVLRAVTFLELVGAGTAR